MVVEAARDDQVVGDERERSRKAERGKTEEQKESRQCRGVGEAPLQRLDRDRPSPALQRPGDETDPRQCQTARHPDGECPAQLRGHGPGESRKHHRRLAHREHSDKTANVALHDGERRAVRGGQQGGVGEHHEFVRDTVGVSDEQPYRGVGRNLRHRHHQRRGQRCPRKQGGIPGVERDQALTDHHRQGDQPAPRRALRAAAGDPRRVGHEQRGANRHAGDGHGHHAAIHPGCRAAADGAPDRRGRGNDRNGPEDRQRRGMRGRERREGDGRTEEQAADPGGRKSTPRRDEHDRQIHDCHIGEQQRGQPVDMHEIAPRQPMADENRRVVTQVPPRRRGHGRHERGGDRSDRHDPGVEPPLGEPQDRDPDERGQNAGGNGGHACGRGGGHDSPPLWSRVEVSAAVPPSTATQRRSARSAAIRAERSGLTTNRETTVSSKPRSRARW